MDRSWINSRHFSKQHIDGVRDFMKLISDRFPESEEVLCPCRTCLNRVAKPKSQIEDHLYINGMASTYTTWIHHGEAQLDAVLNEQADHLHEQYTMNEDYSMNESENPEDRLPEMVRELFTAGEKGAQKLMFAAVLEEMKQELHPGASFTRFSFVVKLLHIKSFYRINNVAFSAILKFLSLAFPKCCVPASYKEAKKLIKALGLGYESIHVCPNNCVLFRKDYEKNNECPVCGASRWKDGEARNKSPLKVLRHFPLIPRLKRMFASAKISEELQWHKLKRKEVENELSHPADGEAWKDFDSKYNWFQQDPRNIRLGLATDGFNPFGKMSSSYSMWPVFVIPYNFPPWVCMDQSNFMMCLLVPGRESPGKDFDVFLQPLVDELQELWLGVSTFDALSRKDFDLHAAVIWCIHDYPGLKTLSDRVTKGYYACVHCDKDPCSRRIRNKICYIGHRRWLPHDHPWRKKKDYDGQIENREKPQEFSTIELMQQLERVKDVKPRKHPNNNKRKRDAHDGQCWKIRSCLWDLPYWKDLKLRHNLDVMHIEKNICEYFLGTFLALPGKSKDSINARLDLEDMGIRKDLHLKRDGDSYRVPHAPYTMDKNQKVAFYDFLRSVKFPDGYASNLASCITADGCNLQGLKTHDCHIILQRILPAALRGIMHKEIYVAIAELGHFFQQLCARTLKLDVLRQMKDNIPIVLCKLEKIFPPALFDVMLHLSIHLPDEAILRGPVQYGWMYPVERRLYTLKHCVRNMARPEGSIAEAYVANECLHACSRYFDDLETRHNCEGRNTEHVDMSKGDISVFQHGVVLLGAPTITNVEKDYDKMVWYVLNNCAEVEPYIELYRKELQNEGGFPDVEKQVEKQFSSWFKNHIGTLRYVRGEDVSADLFALSCEPDLRIRVYSACIVDGVRYHTVDREKNRRTQNSGVMAQGTHNGEDIEFYGCLREIIQLQYNADNSGHRSVVIFRCDWFDTESKKGRLKDDGLFKSINHSCCWYKNDPFILAPQATMVFYLQDTKYGGSWRVVQKFAHRHLWNVDETCSDEIPKGVALSYQDDECVASNIQHTEVNLNNVTAGVENVVIIDASVVDDLRRQREVEGEQNDEPEEDETGWQYASDNEEHTIRNDVDDDSDDD